MTEGLLLPGLVMAVLGWIVPRLYALIFPEGVRPLIVLALVSAATMWLASVAVFVALYAMRGVPMAALFADGALPGLLHFAWLGVLSALFWGPVLILSVAGLPRTWVEETW